MADEGTREKYRRLLEILGGTGGVVVAFSGGVDSTLLLRASRDALGDRVLAVTARSPSYPADEIDGAARLAASLGARHAFVDTREMDDPSFVANGPDRCYHCKRGLFAALAALGAGEGLPRVIDGSNADDPTDHRPGIGAAREAGVRSPLAEAGLGKGEIRALARDLGLPNWDKPSLPCLASRIPYGEEISVRRLARIADAEASVRALGFASVRVRDHGDLARIELDPGLVEGAAGRGLRERLVRACRDAGYVWVALDLEGYRTGAMNEALPAMGREGR